MRHVIPRFRASVALLCVALVAAACSGDGGAATSPAGGTSSPTLDEAAFVAQLASTDHYVGEPQRVNVGVFSNVPEEGLRLVTSGEVEVSIAPFEGGSGTAVEGTARYLPAPGTEVTDGPTLTAPEQARGVYELADATFDAPGIWEATVTFSVDGEGPFEVTATPFQVERKPAYPAPGDRALKTENLTVDSDAPVEAIDSGATSAGEIPDPELHEWTIAEALRQSRPIAVLFSTPAYCASLFCGPVTDALRELHDAHTDEAVFIHVEIWRENPTTLNEAAADWLYRDGNLTEPWLFLIGADGRIVDRWGPLFDVDEVAATLTDLPDAPR